MEGRTRLESWKEISAYLGRSIKTCQRWEVELGLPIHRLDGTPSARVFANPDELDAWVAEKLSHIRERPDAPDALSDRRSKSRWVVLVSAVAVLSAVAAIVAWRPFLKPSTIFPRDVPSVAILPLENATGDEILEAWKIALPRLISFDLIQSRAAGTWPTPDILRVLANLKLSEAKKYTGEDLMAIGQRTKTGYLMTGSLVRSGKDIVLDVSCHDSHTAGVLRSFRTRCSGERGVFPMVDKLSREIKLAMNIPKRLVSSDIDEKVETITTASPEAFKLFCRGEQLAGEGQTSEAIQSFEEAVKLDPEFAEARLIMYWMARNGNATEEAVQTGLRILESIDHLNLSSRFGFEADFFGNVQRDLPKCISALKKNWELLLDENAGHWLADIFYDLEEFDQAIPLLEALSVRNPRNPDYFGHLAYCYAARGLFEKAERTIDDYLGREDKPPAELLWSRSDIALDQKKFDVALSFLDRLHALYPRSVYAVRLSSGIVLLTQDDLDGAEKEFQQIASEGVREQRSFGFRSLMGVSLTRGKVDEAMARARSALEAAQAFGDETYEKEAHYYLAYLRRVSGNLPTALEEIELACRGYQASGRMAIRPLQLKALILLELGREDEFSKFVAEMKRYIEQEKYPKLMRAYYYLLGHWELRQGHWDRAIDHFWKAVTLLPPTVAKSQVDADSVQYWYSLAEAYDRASACVSAEESFKKIPCHWDQRFASGDLYARSFYRIARLQELCGQHPALTSQEMNVKKASAVTNYRKFLSLWEDADPRFSAEVEDARRRLAALEVELAAKGSGSVR